MYKVIYKPFLDCLIALTVLIVLFPLFLGVIILLAIFQDRAVFFTQNRPGKDNKIFKLIKFKTMNNEKDEDGELLPDEQRLTAVGQFVRKTSLDELPQLFNVLKGEMSLIGPRPLLIEYLSLYDDQQIRRHEVKPGITGWAQINGRNSISWQKKFDLDVWYVDNQSFWIDLKILFLTIKKVFIAEGISSEGSVTMEKFKGNC